MNINDTDISYLHSIKRAFSEKRNIRVYEKKLKEGGFVKRLKSGKANKPSNSKLLYIMTPEGKLLE